MPAISLVEKGDLMKRALSVPAIAFLMLLFLQPYAMAQDVSCEDFSTQGQAQVILDQDPSDPNGLDEDGDGIACEDLPSDGAGNDGQRRDRNRNNDDPQGAVDSGLGGTAGSLPYLLLGGGAVLSAAFGAVVGSRRFKAGR